MDIQSIKVDLIHWLTELQDQSILEKLQVFKHQQEKGLSDAHKALLLFNGKKSCRTILINIIDTT
jgi:hypothetical protein